MSTSTRIGRRSQVDLQPGEALPSPQVPVESTPEDKGSKSRQTAINAGVRRQSKEQAAGRSWEIYIPKTRGPKGTRADGDAPATKKNLKKRKPEAEMQESSQSINKKTRTASKPAATTNMKKMAKGKHKTAAPAKSPGPATASPRTRGSAPNINPDQESDQGVAEEAPNAAVPPRQRLRIRHAQIVESSPEDGEEEDDASEEDENSNEEDNNELEQPGDDNDASRLFDDEAPSFASTTTPASASQHQPSTSDVLQDGILSGDGTGFDWDIGELDDNDTMGDKENAIGRPLTGVRAQRLADEYPTILSFISNATNGRPAPSSAPHPVLLSTSSIRSGQKTVVYPWKDRTKLELPTGPSGNTVKSQLPLLKQNHAIQEVIRKSIEKAFIHTCLDTSINPFSSVGMLEISRKCLIQAAETKYGGEYDIAHRLEDGDLLEYVQPISGCTSHRLRILLTKTKDDCVAVVKNCLDLENTEAGRIKAKNLSDLNSYIYPPQTDPALVRAAPFANPVIAKTIGAAFFAKKSKYYERIRASEVFQSSVKDKPMEKEIPKAMVAFACVIIMNVLQSHQTGLYQDFGCSTTHESTYAAILVLLNEVQARLPVWYHTTMHDMYNAAVGTLPLATIQDHAALIASVAWDATATQ
ncbi:hypothetical protein V5O48_009823 [Marasmius crinis-equi]|uniref:DUF6532 domain-containing protein n=1 Tax=Marasmius crinis-equi TaxID=585013 RepID=A0ABR3FA57_9AGAR